MRIIGGMYGLPQSGILANKLLKERLETRGYKEVDHTPGLFKHKTRPVWFTLVVDDLGIKYIGRENVEHLIETLKGFYDLTVDWKGALYCGITLDWHYEEGYVDISMPTYVLKQLLRYAHERPRRPQHCPYEPKAIRYGKSSDILVHEDDGDPLNDKDKKFIQQVVGSFLYYARAVDMTILMALSEIASQQAAPTIAVAALVANPTRAFVFAKYVDWKVIRFLLPGTCIGAVLGAYGFTHLDPQHIKLLVGIFLISTIFQDKLENNPKTLYEPLANQAKGQVESLHDKEGNLQTDPASRPSAAYQ